MAGGGSGQTSFFYQLIQYFWQKSNLLKKILGYFREYFLTERSLPFYLAFFLFLAICFYFNYAYEIETKYFNSQYGNPWLILYFFPLYAVPYYLVTVLRAVFYKEWAIFHKKEFWYRSLFILAVLSLNSGSDWHRTWIRDLVPWQVKYYSFLLMTNIGSSLLFLIPILLFYWCFDRGKVNGLYGLSRHNFRPAPYLVMVLLMAPIVIWASLQPDFLFNYPTYKSKGVTEEFLGIPFWATTILYQVTYGADFIFVELLFRGFMVIGMARVIGKSAIMPMVAVYAFLHFGKPLAEAIGSVFGGFLLGVIAFYSRNIWGGVIVHVGVALSMEWAAFVQFMKRIG